MFSVYVGDVNGDWDNSLLTELRKVVNSPSTTSMVSSGTVALWLSGAIDFKGAGISFFVGTGACMVVAFEVLV